MPKPPICELLNLDQRKLPAEVFDRISDRAGRLKEREERARKAWESFGKPGRDPETVGSLFNLLASNGAWIPHLKMAQMRDHWDQVVGVENAKHSYPASLRDGVLTIRCDSPAWTTTLSYMTPLLTDTIRRKLEGLTINEVRVTGPQSQGSAVGVSQGRFATEGYCEVDLQSTSLTGEIDCGARETGRCDGVYGGFPARRTRSEPCRSRWKPLNSKDKCL